MSHDDPTVRRTDGVNPDDFAPDHHDECAGVDTFTKPVPDEEGVVLLQWCAGCGATARVALYSH